MGSPVDDALDRLAEVFGPRVPAKHASYLERVRNERIADIATVRSALEQLREERDALRRDGLTDLTETARRLVEANALLVEIARWSRVAVLHGDLHARIASSLAETSVPGSCAADVDGDDETVGHHESVGERQGRQPGTEDGWEEDEWEELPEQRLRGYIRAEGSHSMLPYLEELVERAEAAEAEVQRLREGLREIAEWDGRSAEIHGNRGVREYARALLADSPDGGGAK